MMPLSLAQRIVKEWTGEDIDLQDKASAVRVLAGNQSADAGRSDPMGRVQHSQRSAISTLDAGVPACHTPPLPA